MENGPFQDDKHDDLPIENGDFPVCYVNTTRWYSMHIPFIFH
jgi:hypothetical protein